jgi:hypothetical protein
MAMDVAVVTVAVIGAMLCRKGLTGISINAIVKSLVRAILRATFNLFHELMASAPNAITAAEMTAYFCIWISNSMSAFESGLKTFRPAVMAN